jgi:hypothetical protein
VVRGGSPSGPQAVSEDKSLNKLDQTPNKLRIHSCMSVLKLPLLVGLQQEVGEIVLAITSCLSIIILGNTSN